MINLPQPAIDGFAKWLSSTKFQVFMLVFVLGIFLIVVYKLQPADALGKIRDVAIAYMGARVLEPVAEFITKKIGCNGGPNG